MPGLCECMKLMGDIFDKYAGKDGKPQMSKAELAELLRSEFPEAGNNKAVVDSFFSMLDDDGDGVVDFKEFMALVTALTVMTKK
nr:PREDICTED: protein S100-G-like [Paralichthys olivaceus]